jgi:hypothetical protein
MLQARRLAAATLLAASPALLHAQRMNVAAAAAPQAQVTVTGAQLALLDARLQTFAAQLPAAERQAWSDLLRRAAAAPANDPAGARVQAVLYVVPSSHIIVQGGIQPMPTRPASSAASAVHTSGHAAVAIGPKQDDPAHPNGGQSVNAIGPKPDDPRAPDAALMSRLRAFGQGLSPEDRAALDWLFQRAAPRDAGSGMPTGRTPSLAQALGVSPLAIGPKQDDPSPPPPADARWIVRF